MKAEVSLPIKASKNAIWDTITDIKNADKHISGIEKIEVLNDPEEGLLGFEWTETRIIFGKEAVETMRISKVEEGKYYETHAENHGAIYKSRMSVIESDGQSVLSMSFESEPQTLMARIMGPVMGLIMKGSMKKLMLKDLEDIRSLLESRAK